MKGYKVFENDWKCLGFQYEVGKVYKHEGEIVPCQSGFHFSKRLVDCFRRHDCNPDIKVVEIETTGNIDTSDSIEYVTDKIKIIRELSWVEVLDLLNIGKGNTGYGNSGDWNSGDFNTGYENSGDCNSGINNSGDWNSGNGNHGTYNSGHDNSGSWNSGSRNFGNHNTGDFNSGNWNAGDFNSGNYNTGRFNSGSFNTGFFNNANPKTITVFNKEIPFDKMNEINKNDGYIKFGINFKLIDWVEYDDMTDEEKTKYPDAKNTKGYLKKYTYKEACKNAWNEMTDDEKEEFKKLPCFDPIIFKDITGIDVNE